MKTHVLTALAMTAVLTLAWLSLGASAVSEGDATPLKVKQPPHMGRVEPLGRTVELTFRLKSKDPQTITITCATTRYYAEINFAGAAAAADLRFAGELRLVEAPGKSGRAAERLLVTTQAGVAYDADQSINAHFETSAQIEYDEETYLVRYGELSLTVEAKLVE